MKRTAALVAAFAAGLIVSATATRARADASPIPAWFTKGACFVAPESGREVVLETQGGWVRTTRSPDGSELWRNVAEAGWLQRLPPEACRDSR